MPTPTVLDRAAFATQLLDALAGCAPVTRDFRAAEAMRRDEGVVASECTTETSSGALVRYVLWVDGRSCRYLVDVEVVEV